MNILGTVLSSSIFQQKDHQQSLTANGTMSKCSSVHYVVNDTSSFDSSRKAKKKTALDGKPTHSTLNSGSCKISSNGSKEVSTLLDGSVTTSSDGLIFNVFKGEEHVKKCASKKKKKKKKKKLGKGSSSDVNSVAVVEIPDQTCPETENTYGTTKTLSSLFAGKTGDSTDGISSDCSRIAQTISVSEEIKPSLASANAQCTSTRSKEVAGTFVSKESVLNSIKHDFSRNTSDGQKVEKCSSTMSETKQDTTFSSSAVTSKDFDSEPSFGSSKCVKDCDDRLSSSSSYPTKVCVSRSYTPLSNNGNQNTDARQNGSKKTICEASRLDINEGKVIFCCDGCKFEEPTEMFSFGSLPETIFARANSKTCSCGNESTCKGENRAVSDGSTFGIKFNKVPCGIREADVATANRSPKQDQGHSLSSMLHKRGFKNNVKHSGKENRNFTWKRVHEKIGQTEMYNRREFMHGDRCTSSGLQEVALLSESNFSSRQSSFPENFRGFDPFVHPRGRNYGHILEDSSQWVPQLKSLGYVGWKGPVRYYSAENRKGRWTEKMTLPSRWEKGMQCRRDFLVSRSNLHRPQTRAVVFWKRVLEVPSIEHKFKSSSTGETTHDNQCSKHNLSEIQNLGILDSASSNNRPSPQTLSNPLNGVVKQENSLKQMPVSSIDAIAMDCMKCVATKEPNCGVFREAPNLLAIRTDAECPDILALNRGVCLGEKNVNTTSSLMMNNHSVCISSHMASQVLNASYRSRTASECVKLAIGNPIAEFERLLDAVSPVIFPSSVCRHHDDCIKNQFNPDVSSRHRLSDVLLVDIWSWYEEHGNYGLEIKVEPPGNLKNVCGDSSPFHAYFVPSLSAVQLFCHSQHPKHGSNLKNDNVVVKKRQDGICSLPSAIIDHYLPENLHPNCCEVGEEDGTNLPKFMGKCTRPLLFHSSDENSLPLTPALASFDDSDLLFEYFEHERPEQRKPLCTKIKELVEGGGANHQMYEDPSKLECMNLQDLHPASWYSVAWYPIYRIPEGTFRAAFLTYHSLGHLVKRCIKADSVGDGFCSVSPVLGMESYNAQGECWFNLREAVEIFSQSGVLFNSSEILKERLRTLGEAAAIFSRGIVYKNQVQVRNTHPDYEFFLSRKQRISRVVI